MNTIIFDIGRQIEEGIKSLVYSPTPESPQKVSIAWQNLLSSPPPNNSATTQQELSFIVGEVNSKTAIQKQLIYKVDEDPALLFFPYLEQHGLQFPKKYFNAAWDILGPVVMNLKWHYNRPRPYQLGPKYGIQIDHITTSTHNSPAYPSGHAAYGVLVALVLSNFYPAHASEFHKIAPLVGHARVLQGVHYPSDNKAGTLVATAVWNKIKHNLS